MTGASRSRQVIDSITRTAKQAEEQQREAVSPNSAPGKKDRNWEQDHPAIPLRLQSRDIQWLRNFADEHSITLDTAAQGLIQAIRNAVKQGLVTFTIEQEIEQYEDTLGRQRTRVHTELEADWQIPRS